MRRKFYEIADSSPVAAEVLRRIALLYAIEDEVRGSPAEQQRIFRERCGRVIVDDLRQYLDARNRQVSAKSKLGEAIRYAHSVGRARALPRRWAYRPRQQHRRTLDPTAGA
jgi:hypothetical protein